MPKLNQIIAIVSGQKSEAEKALTETYHALQKPELFSGLTRVYTAKNDSDGDTKPPERKNPQKSVKDLFASIEATLAKTYDNVATQDWGNCQAKADVVVDGVPILKDVPVTHLLFLEHKLQDFKTFVDKMPVRDGADEWVFNTTTNSFVAQATQKEVTRKDQVPIVLFPATDKHPAQTQLITKDVVVGHWEEKRFSTAISVTEKEAMLKKVVKLNEAVKQAREEANSIPVEKKEVAGKLLDYVFGGILK